jgi:hypothetical protein
VLHDIVIGLFINRFAFGMEVESRKRRNGDTTLHYYKEEVENS